MIRRKRIIMSKGLAAYREKRARMCCIVPMDRPHPWIKYLSLEIGTISWSYSTHLMDIFKILIFYFTSSIVYIIKIYKKYIIN